MNTTDVPLTFNPLTWKIWRAPNNSSKWQMGFNSAFKGLIDIDCTYSFHLIVGITLILRLLLQTCEHDISGNIN